MSHDYLLDPHDIAGRVDEVNAALRAADIELSVVAGAEVAGSRAVDLDRSQLEAACIGSGRYLLFESPYGYVGESLERIVHDLALGGFRVLLAHPERSACFAGRLDRLRGFVERGALCSITAASLSGRFGRPVRSAAREMLRAGVVHDVASDAHGPEQRTPRLTPAAEGIAPAEWSWLTEGVPAAIVAGADPPPRPEPEGGGEGGLARAFARLRGR